MSKLTFPEAVRLAWEQHFRELELACQLIDRANGTEIEKNKWRETAYAKWDRDWMLKGYRKTRERLGWQDLKKCDHAAAADIGLKTCPHCQKPL